MQLKSCIYLAKHSIFQYLKKKKEIQLFAISTKTSIFPTFSFQLFQHHHHVKTNKIAYNCSLFYPFKHQTLDKCGRLKNIEHSNSSFACTSIRCGIQTNTTIGNNTNLSTNAFSLSLFLYLVL